MWHQAICRPLWLSLPPRASRSRGLRVCTRSAARRLDLRPRRRLSPAHPGRLRSRGLAPICGETSTTAPRSARTSSRSEDHDRTGAFRAVMKPECSFWNEAVGPIGSLGGLAGTSVIPGMPTPATRPGTCSSTSRSTSRSWRSPRDVSRRASRRSPRPAERPPASRARTGSRSPTRRSATASSMPPRPAPTTRRSSRCGCACSKPRCDACAARTPTAGCDTGTRCGWGDGEVPRD